jgi:hypothetical protein
VSGLGVRGSVLRKLVILSGNRPAGSATVAAEYDRPSSPEPGVPNPEKVSAQSFNMR